MSWSACLPAAQETCNMSHQDILKNLWGQNYYNFHNFFSFMNIPKCTCSIIDIIIL